MTSPPKPPPPPPKPPPPADDFDLAAHDGIGGRSLLPGRVLGIGLGAALIGELLFWRRLRADGDLLHMVDTTPTGDPATSSAAGCLHHWPSWPPTPGHGRRLGAGGGLTQPSRHKCGPGEVRSAPAATGGPNWPAALT